MLLQHTSFTDQAYIMAMHIVWWQYWYLPSNWPTK